MTERGATPRTRLIFSAGTAAELIKLFPIMQRALRRGVPFAAVSTGQSPRSFELQWDDFGYSRDRYVAAVDTDRDLRVATDALRWFGRAMVLPKKTLAERLRPLAEPSRGDLWIIHGDTLSTLVGGIWGRRFGADVGHVEAGLRSRDLREPFPEEIMRTAAGQLAHLHFCPTAGAVRNLTIERARGQKILTYGNTQIDAMEEALALPPPDNLPEGAYGLVNIHRYETLTSPERSADVRRILRAASERHRLIAVAHETTDAWAESDPAFRRDLERAGATWLPRQPFTRFAHWLARASFVIADSGGNQQECDYLGKPCLLLRMKTEQPIEGESVILSRFEDRLIEPFLRDPERYVRKKRELDHTPADIVWQHLEGRFAHPSTSTGSSV